MTGRAGGAVIGRAFERHFGAGPADYRRALPSALLGVAADAVDPRRAAVSDG